MEEFFMYSVFQQTKKFNKIKTPDAVTFATGCSQTVMKVFCNENIKTDGEYIIKSVIDKSKEFTFIENDSILTDEKYRLEIEENEAVITASCEKGLYRGAYALAKILKSDEFYTGEIIDYPLFGVRGYIEGFYGKPWTAEERVSVMRLAAKYGMSTYYYAPKDDVYHREKWNIPYPEKELKELTDLFLFAKENFIDFYWCIGPGLSYEYSSDSDFRLLYNKLLQLYEIGIRNFGLLFDDIPDILQHEADKEKFDDVVSAQTYLINRLYRELKEHDKSIKLTVCPTQYSGDTDSYYISKFGRSISTDVDIFWTGEEICSRVLRSSDARDLIRSTGHKPLYWDNYPVNDCEMFDRMHLDGIQGRDRDLYKYSAGFISNVMEYAECTKIPLITICDYLWNPYAYDKAKSTANAHKIILGEEKAEKFAYMADHLGVSCLTQYTSNRMSAMTHRVWDLYNSGNESMAIEELRAYIEKMHECSEMMHDKSVPLFKELDRWCQKYDMAFELMTCIYEMLARPDEAAKKLLEDKLEQYNYTGVPLTGFCLRELANRALTVTY